MTEQELYQRLISKYPEYSSIEQSELMPKIYAKYPEYQEVVESPTIEPEVVSDERKLPLKQFAIGGLPAFGLTPGSEEALPMAGQMVGGTMGGFGGAVGGSAVGDLARRGIQTIRDGKQFDLKDAGKDALKTAVVEGAFRGAGKVISPYIKPTANRLMMSVLNPEKYVRKNNPNLGLEAIERGLTGTRKQIYNKSQNLVESSASKVDDMIKGAKGEVDVLDVASKLDDLKATQARVGDTSASGAIDDIQQALMRESPTGKINPQQAQELKQLYYGATKPNQFGMVDVPIKTEARKNVAYGLKKGIEGVIDDPALALANKNTGIGIESRDAIGNQIANNSSKFTIPFFDTVGFLGGIGTGNPLISGAILARRALNTPYVKSKGAQAINQLGKLDPSTHALARTVLSEGTRRYT